MRTRAPLKSEEEDPEELSNWFGRWKYELEPRRWTNAEVAEHLAIVQDEEDEESSDDSSDWSYSGGVTVFARGLNALRNTQTKEQFRKEMVGAGPDRGSTNYYLTTMRRHREEQDRRRKSQANGLLKVVVKNTITAPRMLTSLHLTLRQPHCW